MAIEAGSRLRVCEEPIKNRLRQLPLTHELVSEVAYDTENFTSRTVVVSERRPGPDELPAPIGLAPPITSDPPFHAIVRRVLLPAFAPKATAALEPFTRELCRELLAATVGRASFDAAVGVYPKFGLFRFSLWFRGCMLQRPLAWAQHAQAR